MKVSELLDELREQVLRDTSNLVSGSYDKLWTDASLIRYLDEAHRRFARRTFCLRDKTTPEVTQIELVEGQDDYLLHKSVISILSARYNTDTFDLKRTGHHALFSSFPVDTQVFDVNLMSTTEPGRPVAFSTDEGIDSTQNNATVLRVYPTPSATEAGTILYLRVARGPIVVFSEEEMEDQEPEIPEDYHLDLVEWAAYRALRTVDADGEDYGKAAKEHRARFDEAVQEAKNDVRRRFFAPLGYAFGQNAFSWES